MNTGYVINKDFSRPSKEIVELFYGIPVPNIGDSMNRTAAVSASLKAVNSARLQGPSYTVRVPAGDNLLFYYAIDNAKPGDVIVVDGGGFAERALCGGIMASFAKKKGLAGFVVYGAVRDRVELSQMDFPVFYCAACPNGPYKNGPGEINVPVNIGGRIVEPGDILIGDEDGLVVVHPDEAVEISEKAHAVMKKESGMMKLIEEEGRMDLGWMYKKIESDGCQIL